MLSLDLKNPTKHRVKIEGAFTIEDDRFFLIVSPFAKHKDLWDMPMNITFVPDVPTKIQRQELLQKTMGCLAVGLAALHRDGFWHRDIHTGNILFHNGEVLFCDFGASRYSAAPSGPGTTRTRRAPRMDRYAAPEVHSTRESEKGGHNEKTEVFSLGALFYEIYYAVFDPERLDHLTDGGWRYSAESRHISREWMHDITSLTQRFHLFKSLTTLPAMLRRRKENRPSALKVAADIYTAQHKLGLTFMCDDCESWIRAFGYKEIEEMTSRWLSLYIACICLICLISWPLEPKHQCYDVFGRRPCNLVALVSTALFIPLVLYRAFCYFYWYI